MNALDHSSLEALAFNYLNYGLLTAVNNIWTWVAVITAAVSFLTIKASSAIPRGKIPDGRFISSPVERIAPEPAASTSGEPVETASTTSSSCKTTTFRALEREGSTKEKFTSYYYNDDDDDEDSGTWKGGDKGEVNGGDGGEEVVEEGWWDRWEKVMKMKMGDEEWYRYQDLTVINGNVVRLWDGCRRRNNNVGEYNCSTIASLKPVIEW